MYIYKKGKYIIITNNPKSNSYIALEENIIDLITLNKEEFLEIINPHFVLKYFLPYIYLFFYYIAPYKKGIYIKNGEIYDMTTNEKITIIETPTYQYDFAKNDIYKVYFTSQ